MTGDYRSILEGVCPHCGRVLKREVDCGWCESCDVGWRFEGDGEVTVVIRADDRRWINLSGVGARSVDVRTLPTSGGRHDGR